MISPQSILLASRARTLSIQHYNSHNNAQRASECASAKARNSFHIFSPASQNNKLPPLPPLPVPPPTQRGRGKQGASVDGATHDFSRCGDATPIKRFRFGPRTETTFCSPLRLSSLCLPHMCVPKASRSPVTFRACARWHQSTQRFLQSRPTKEKRSEAWLITRSYSLQSALLREPIIRRQTSGSLRRRRRRCCPLC